MYASKRIKISCLSTCEHAICLSESEGRFWPSMTFNGGMQPCFIGVPQCCATWLSECCGSCQVGKVEALLCTESLRSCYLVSIAVSHQAEPGFTCREAEVLDDLPPNLHAEVKALANHDTAALLRNLELFAGLDDLIVNRMIVALKYVPASSQLAI